MTENFLDADSWSVAHCATQHEREEVGSFTVTTREGIQLAPDDLLPGLGLFGLKQEEEEEMEIRQED